MTSTRSRTKFSRTSKPDRFRGFFTNIAVAHIAPIIGKVYAGKTGKDYKEAMDVVERKIIDATLEDDS